MAVRRIVSTASVAFRSGVRIPGPDTAMGTVPPGTGTGTGS